jgi:hypothetical protein
VNELTKMTDYVEAWGKLHDVHFVISEGSSYVEVKFDGRGEAFTKEFRSSYRDNVSSCLYDLVYGVRGDVCPDTVRHEEDIF